MDEFDLGGGHDGVWRQVETPDIAGGAGHEAVSPAGRPSRLGQESVGGALAAEELLQRREPPRMAFPQRFGRLLDFAADFVGSFGLKGIAQIWLVALWLPLLVRTPLIVLGSPCLYHLLHAICYCGATLCLLFFARVPCRSTPHDSQFP